MAPPWPSGAQPVCEWGQLKPGSSSADLVEVPSGKKLAVSSLLFSFSKVPERALELAIKWETVVYGGPGHVGGPELGRETFYEMRLPVGPNLQLCFPTPLVLASPDHGVWWFRLRPTTPWVERGAPDVNILSVGYTF